MAGFESDLKARIMGIRPHLTITRSTGPFTAYAQMRQRLEPIDGIASASAFVTTQVVLRTADRAAGAVLKGIDVNPQSRLYSGVNTSRLAAPPAAVGNANGQAGIILGRELAASLGVLRGDTVYIISPRGMLSPAGHIPAMVKFQVVDLFESGMYEFDGTLAFIDLAQAQQMLRMPGQVSGLEIRLENLDRSDGVAGKIKSVVGRDYTIENWKQMNRSLFSALQLEKTVMFIILTLIILVAAFNIAGSLVMMVMEKRKDIAILKTMGATSAAIGRIFVIKGLTIGLAGTVLGACAGVTLCALLKRYAFVHLPADVYYINTLPVHLKASDVLTIAVSALFICLAATLYPARQAAGINPVEAIRHG
jgi:lipoprotein-releasing system permease protein